MYPNMQDWVASCIRGIWTQRLTSGRDSTWLSLSPQPDTSSHHQMAPTTIKKRDVRLFPGNCGSRREEKMVVDSLLPPPRLSTGKPNPPGTWNQGGEQTTWTAGLSWVKCWLHRTRNGRAHTALAILLRPPTLQQERLSIYFETPVFNVKTLDLQPAQYITSKHSLKQ